MSTVLLTRPASDSALLAAQLAENDIESVICPVIHIRHLTVPHLPPADALILTSRHALHAARGVESPCYVVGENTANLARKNGMHVARTASTAEALAPLLPQTARLLYLSGENISYDFSHPCLTRVAVYEAKAAEALSQQAIRALQAGQITGAAFYSARSARLFHQLLHKEGIGNQLKNAVAYCMSAAVAQECDQSLWHRIAIAQQPDAEAMLTLLLQEK